MAYIRLNISIRISNNKVNYIPTHERGVRTAFSADGASVKILIDAIALFSNEEV